MKATTKKIYSLASAILMVVLSVLLFVGALMPMFKVNMANIEVAEGFEKGYFTQGLEVDEAKVGFAGALKLLANKEYVSVINKVQNNQQKIRRSLRTYGSSSVGYEAQAEKIEKWQKEIETTLDSLTEADYEAMEALFQDEDFIEALYLEIGFVSLFADIFTQGNEENYIYTSNNVLAVFTMIFGMIFLAGFMVCMVIFTIISFFSALKRVIALATGFKSIDLKKHEKFYPGKNLTALLPTMLFFVLAKAMMGSKLVMGSGIVMIIVCFIIIGVLRATNKIMLRERRNPKHIAKVLIGLVATIFVICIFNNVTNMNLVEAYYRSNDVNVEAVYEATKQAAYAENVSKLNPSSYGSLEAFENALENCMTNAKHTAEEHVTKILTKNAIQLLGIVLLSSVFTFVLLALSLNRVRENNDDKVSSYSAEKYGPHYVVAAILLVCVFLMSTLGVATVDERNDAYLVDEEVKILWNDYTLEGSGTKEEYDALVEAHDAALKAIEEGEKLVAETEDVEMKKELEFELAMAKRAANRMALKIETLENDDTALRSGTIALIIVVIVLEILYQMAPSLIDKFLPEKVKSFLAGNDDEVDTSIDVAYAGAAPVAAAPAAPAAPVAPTEAPASAGYEAPAKEKSFKSDDEAPKGDDAGDDLAAQMQRMFDGQN